MSSLKLNMISSKKISKALLVSLLGFSFTSHAAITLDRTRTIFNGSDKSITIVVSNKNKKLPYLAQAWIENENSEKITSPFIIVPPLQRLEPEQSSQVRIEALSQIKNLPQDRESLFYFNLREIPPKSSKPNVLQIALQSKIKLFYRPSSLILTPNQLMNQPWQEDLVLLKNGKNIIAKNPTPYFTTIVSAGKSKNTPDIKDFQAVMIPPLGEKSLNVDIDSLGNTPVLTYVNDYGGRKQMKFQCQMNECSVIKTPIKGDDSNE